MAVWVLWHGSVYRRMLWFLQRPYGTGMVWHDPSQPVGWWPFTGVIRVSWAQRGQSILNGHGGHIFTHPCPELQFSTVADTLALPPPLTPSPCPFPHSKCETVGLLHILAPLNGPRYRHSKCEMMVECVTPSTLKDTVRTIAESADPGPWCSRALRVLPSMPHWSRMFVLMDHCSDCSNWRMARAAPATPHPLCNLHQKSLRLLMPWIPSCRSFFMLPTALINNCLNRTALGTVKPGLKWSFRRSLRCGFKGWLQAREAVRSWSQREVSKRLWRRFDTLSWFWLHARHTYMSNKLFF